ncbi:hypothetical protein X793_01790 [Dehalococcoides mccartyi CG4]|nr:hypothetical protein X793_01790 [Dehalococcoides mccartyi CG4]
MKKHTSLEDTAEKRLCIMTAGIRQNEKGSPDAG